MVQKILAIRDCLESHNARRSAFTGIGAEVIQWELRRRRIKKIPAILTIARILSRFGRVRKKKVARNSADDLIPMSRQRPWAICIKRIW
jgi:hypothetical protein